MWKKAEGADAPVDYWAIHIHPRGVPWQPGGGGGPKKAPVKRIMRSGEKGEVLRVAAAKFSLKVITLTHTNV